MKRIITICACATMLCSCYTTRVLVGDVKPNEPMIEVSKKHDAHFLGGLVKTAKNIAEEHVGEAENFMIRSQYGFGDIMLSAISLGIYTPTTSKYYIPVRHLDGFQPVNNKRNVKPTKKYGFTVMLDGMFAINPFVDEEDVWGIMTGGALTLGYRIGPHFLVGVGGRAGWQMCGGESYNVSIADSSNKFNQESNGGGGEGIFYEGFARIRYTMLNKRCTPYINIDGGYGSYSGPYGDQWKLKTSNGGTWSLTPSFGVQCRLGGNTYLDFGVGYRLTGNTSYIYEQERYDYYLAKTFKAPSHGLFAQIGFSITL